MQNRHSKTCWKNRISQTMANKDNDRSDLIADYCNNRLNADERADFESRLQEDQELLDECNDFQEFQNLYRQIDPAELSPSDAIFDRISRKVSVNQKVDGKAPVHSSALARSIYDFWQRIRESVAVPWMFAAVQAVVIVLLLIPAPEQNTYSTLSATKMAANAEKIDINVVFRSNAPESDIRSLLHTIQGSISGGPSREGRYVVSVNNWNDLDQAVRTLKQSAIVLFAEPVFPLVGD
jgi:anti-sigma-K factor RskA